MPSFLHQIKALVPGLKKRDAPPSEDQRALIGRLLKEKEIITEEQLRHALEVQQERRAQLAHPLQLGMIMVELGFADEEEVVEVINEHYRLSATSLSDNVDELIRERQTSPLLRILTHPLPMWLQLSIITTLIVTGTIISLSLVTLREQRDQLYQQTVKIGKVSLNYFTKNAGILLLEDNVLKLNNLITEATSVEGIRYAAIIDQKGITRAHTDASLIGERFAPFDPAGPAIHDGDNSYFDYVSDRGENILNLSRNIILKGTVLGEVHVGISLDFIEELVSDRSNNLILVSVLIILTGIFITVLFGLHFTRPISKLVQATREIRKGNYHFRVSRIRKDEIGNLALSFNQMSRELWLKSLMQKSFGKYVGAEVLEMILVNPESDWLKGRKSHATILFTDIRGFTAYSKSKEPEEVVDRLNEYFEIATNIILRYGGYVDKFVGDAVLGVFGVPIYYEDHMERAVQAALDMKNDFCNNGQDCSDTLLNSVGISINTGVVVSGNIGSQVKMEYTVIGDTVNIASRLNALAGPGDIIISDSIYTSLKDMLEVEIRPLQRIKGRNHPVPVYNITRIKEKNGS